MSLNDPNTAAAAVRAAFVATPGAAELEELAAGSGLPLYLTGGFVRDALLVRGRGRDLDFAVPGRASPSLATAWARLTHGAAVPLDRDRGTWRVAEKREGSLRYWDFTELRGSDITADLLLRDFTVNAVALPLGPGPASLLDPSGGLRDLGARIIRHVYPETFRDDPVRRLRGYRLAAELGFDIDPETLRLLPGPDLVPLVSGERIREEMAHLLSSARSAPLLGKMTDAGLLDSLWPAAGPGLDHLTRIEDFLEGLGSAPSDRDLCEFLEGTPTHEIPRSALLKLICLARPAGLSPGDSREDLSGYVTALGRHLFLGRKAMTFQAETLEALDWLKQKLDHLASAEGPWIFFDRHSQGALGGLILWAALQPGDGQAASLLEEMLRFYRERYLPDRDMPPLLPAVEVQRLTGLSPGPVLGDFLHRLVMARRLGFARDAEEARRWLREGSHGAGYEASDEPTSG